MSPAILVIGKSGQVGTALAALGSERPISAIDRDGLDLEKLTSAEQAVATLDEYMPAAVINAAAYTAVDLAESETAKATAINVRAPGFLAEACTLREIPFIHISTDFVFDGQKTTPYTEDDAPNPLSVYGQTKRDGELAVLAADGPHAILRTSWVFSPTGKNFVKTMLRLGNEKDELTIVADQQGIPTPADKIAEATLTMADSLLADPDKAGLYHFAGDEPTSWAGLARATLCAAGITTPVRDITTADYPTPATRPAYSVLDTSRIQQTFGIAPANWKAGVERTVKTLTADNTAR